MSALMVTDEKLNASLKSHDLATRGLHWATALLVLTLYGLSLAWERMPKGGPKHLAIVTHMSLGILLTFVLIIRIAWRLSPRSTPQDREPGVRGLVARVMHMALYVCLVLQVLSGWNFHWAEGEPLSFFGLLIMPPFDYPDEAPRVIGLVHYWTGTITVALAFLHAAAALYHHFVLHDDVLTRMMPNLATMPQAMQSEQKLSEGPHR